MPQDLHGIVVPMVTPMQSDGSIDTTGLRTIVDYLIERRVHGLFPCGSQGELYALQTNERKEIFDVTLAQNNGRIPVIASTGAITTQEALDLSRYAAQAGADAISVITPYFIDPSRDELYAHFSRILEAVEIPVLAYNNPGRTGVSLSPDLAADLAESADHFIGIKDSSGDLTNTMGYISRCPKDFRVFMGRDTLIYAGLSYGCVGAVAATANVVPELVVDIYDAFQQRDHPLAKERQYRLAPLREAFSLGSFPVVVKEAMDLLGLPVGNCRAPIQRLKEDARHELVDILKQLGKPV